MKAVALGCLIGLGGWLALGAVLSWQLQAQLELPWTSTLGVSALAGLFGWAALNLLHASWQSWRERAAVGAGAAGRAPADGRRVVLVGTLEALGEPLRAPLDGSPCVAYELKVTEDRGTGRRRMILTHFRGSGLVPSVIVTPSGRHRLLVVPDLQGSPPATPSSRHVEAFERHARAVRVTPPKDAAQELVNRWTDADGAYRADVRYTPVEALDLTRCRLEQQHIRPGAPVCAIGTYSAARGGLVPGPGWAGGARLIEGHTHELLRKLGAQLRTRLLLGLLAALAAAGLVAAFVHHMAGE